MCLASLTLTLAPTKRLLCTRSHHRCRVVLPYQRYARGFQRFLGQIKESRGRLQIEYDPAIIPIILDTLQSKCPNVRYVHFKDETRYTYLFRPAAWTVHIDLINQKHIIHIAYTITSSWLAYNQPKPVAPEGFVVRHEAWFQIWDTDGFRYDFLDNTVVQDVIDQCADRIPPHISRCVLRKSLPMSSIAKIVQRMSPDPDGRRERLLQFETPAIFDFTEFERMLEESNGSITSIVISNTQLSVTSLVLPLLKTIISQHLPACTTVSIQARWVPGTDHDCLEWIQDDESISGQFDNVTFQFSGLGSVPVMCSVNIGRYLGTWMSTNVSATLTSNVIEQEGTGDRMYDYSRIVKWLRR